MLAWESHPNYAQSQICLTLSTIEEADNIINTKQDALKAIAGHTQVLD